MLICDISWHLGFISDISWNLEFIRNHVGWPNITYINIENYCTPIIVDM